MSKVSSSEYVPNDQEFKRIQRDFKAIPALYRLSSPGELRGHRPLVVWQGCEPDLFSNRVKWRCLQHGEYVNAIIEKFWLVFPERPGNRTIFEVELYPDDWSLLAAGKKIKNPLGVYLWNLWRPGHHGYYFYRDLQPPKAVAALVHSFHDEGLNSQDRATRIEVIRFKNTESFADVLNKWVADNPEFFPNWK